MFRFLLFLALSVPLLFPALSRAQDDEDGEEPAAHEEGMHGEGHEGTAHAEGKGGGIPKTPPMLSEDFVGRLEKQLGLSPEQRGKVQDVVNQAKPGVQAKFGELMDLRKKAEALRKEMHALMLDMKEKIRGLLTMEQKEKFDAMMQGMRRRHLWDERDGHKDRRRFPGPHPEKPGEEGDMPPPEKWEPPRGRR